MSARKTTTSSSPMQAARNTQRNVTSRRACARIRRRPGPPNVWPIPSASGCGCPGLRVCINVSGLRASPWPRWRSARPGPHKGVSVERHFAPEASITPVDCQAIVHSPPADFGSPPSRPRATRHLRAAPTGFTSTATASRGYGPWLKEWRAVATRYEKTAVSFASVLRLAATGDWIK